METLRAILATERPGPALPGLTFVVRNGLTAVFAKAPLLRGLGRSRRRHLREAESQMRDLEALMPRGTVLPALAGSYLPSRLAPTLIDANRPLLEAQIARLRGLVQFQLRIAWDQARVLAHFRTAPEIAPLFATETVAATALETGVTRLAERLRTVFAAECRTVARELIDLPREEGELFNAALLVSDTALNRLDSALDAMDAVWSEGLRLRLIGPAPAVSFASLRIHPHGAGDIDAARKLLGLASQPTAEEIAEARKSALRIAAGTAGTAGAADVVRRAARLLDAWTAAGCPPGGIPVAKIWQDGQAETDTSEAQLAWAV